MMKKIIVKLRKNHYPIVIDYGLLENFVSYWPLKTGDVAVFITNDRVAAIYLNKFNNVLNQAGIITDQLILPDGEYIKSLDMLNMIFTKLLTQNYDRNTVLIALGGGVIGDLTGFAAATYQRGIRFIQAPTTLLAQVDASIGGKTGINHVLGKNMIGSFYQPISVIIDLNCLSTLSLKEFSFGLAEVIKYAIVFDEVFFIWLEDNLDELLKLNSESIMYCVYRCCELKSAIVVKDEYDMGIRNMLNLGHTYGHAIESYFKYDIWSHGEAVSVGIVLSINTSLRLNEFTNITDVDRILTLLKRAGLPVRGPAEMSPRDYIRYMICDKKSKAGSINLVLPISIGHAKLFTNVNHDVILQSIKDNLYFNY